jgi:thiol-disulfide isomerase/thioredoxin
MDARVAIGGCLLLVAAIGVTAAVRHDWRGPSAEPAVKGEPVILRLFKDPVPVKSLTLQTLDGRAMTTADWRGKVTLVNFWATWCPPCRAEIPDLIALQERYKDHLQIIGISEDQGATEVVNQFVVEHQINYPIVMATPELEQGFAGVAGLPTTFVIDREGHIVQKHVGLLSAETTEREMKALAGLVPATIERVESEKAVGLENAAQVKEIPGVDLADLSPDVRAATRLRLNAEPCTCGCGLTVAKCRVDDPSCAVSLPRAREIAADVSERRQVTVLGSAPSRSCAVLSIRSAQASENDSRALEAPHGGSSWR